MPKKISVQKARCQKLGTPKLTVLDSKFDYLDLVIFRLKMFRFWLFSLIAFYFSISSASAAANSCYLCDDRLFDKTDYVIFLNLKIKSNFSSQTRHTVLTRLYLNGSNKRVIKLLAMVYATMNKIFLIYQYLVSIDSMLNSSSK